MIIDKPITIILVHGTWGRAKINATLNTAAGKKLAWYQEGSSFYRQLTRELDRWSACYKIENFEWSGANSVRERDAAAKLLSERIETHKHSAGSEVVVIAHSHGGNVAVRALEYLKSAAVNIRLITLASPFMEILPIQRRKEFRRAIFITSTLFVGLSLYILSFFLNIFGVSLVPLADSLAFPFITILLLGLCFFAVGAIEIYSESHTKRLAKLTEGSAVIQQKLPILILRAPNDEADLTMAAGTIGNMVCSGMLTITTMFFRFMTVVLVCGCLLYTSNEMFNKSHHFIHVSKLAYTFQYNQIFIFGLMLDTTILIFIILLLGSLFKMVYGWDTFFTSFTSKITQSSAIDSDNSAQIKTLVHSEDKSLSHYIYNNPQCATAISDWIRTHGPQPSLKKQ